ncbi:hypothetical protein BC829DRAFT_393547, partial [Chytridium lagenaria]
MLSAKFLLYMLKQLHQADSIAMTTTSFVTDFSFEQSDNRSTIVAHSSICALSNSALVSSLYESPPIESMEVLTARHGMMMDEEENVSRRILVANILLVDYQTGEVFQHRVIPLKRSGRIIPVVNYLDLEKDILVIIDEDTASRTWKGAQVYSAAHVEPSYLTITFPATLSIQRIIPNPLEPASNFHRPSRGSKRKGTFMILGISRGPTKEGFRSFIPSNADIVSANNFMNLPIAWLGKGATCISECVPYAKHLVLTGHEGEGEGEEGAPKIVVWDIEEGTKVAWIRNSSMESLFWGFAFMDEPDDFSRLSSPEPNSFNHIKTLENAVVRGTWNRPCALTVVSIADAEGDCQVVAWNLEPADSAYTRLSEQRKLGLPIKDTELIPTVESLVNLTFPNDIVN